MYLLVNSQLLKEEDFHLSVTNRAFNYGDGLFETLIANSNEVRFLRDHLARLQEGLAVLKINSGTTLELNKIKKEILSLIQANSIKEKARIKIIAWRKTGGLFSPETNGLEYLINATAHTSSFHLKKKVFFYKEMRKEFSPLSKFKTLSSLHYIMAGIFRKEKNADDVILLDNYGNISECLNSTIFWIKDQYIFTPSLSTGCIEGVMRKQLIAKLKKQNIIVIEGEFSPKDIIHADFVFSSNVAGLVPILSIEDHQFSESHPLFEELAKEFNA